MKKKIIELGKKYGLNLYVSSYRDVFDIIDYDVNIDSFLWRIHRCLQTLYWKDKYWCCIYSRKYFTRFRKRFNRI